MGYEVSKFKFSYWLWSKNNLTFFLGLIWNIPILSTFGLNYYPNFLGDVYIKLFDQGWFEYYGGQNLYWSFKKTSFFQFFSFNHLKIYLLIIIIWLIYLFLNI